jgi:hypothetical protein
MPRDGQIAQFFVGGVDQSFGDILAAVAPARANVTHERLGFLYGYIRIAAESDQLIGGIACHEPAVAPMIRQTNLMDRSTTHLNRPHPLGDQHTLQSPRAA